MPYEWQAPEGDTQILHLWAHRALDQKGFVGFIATTALLITLPALAVLGSPVLWALLPFLYGTIAAIWLALRKNARDREVLEILRLSPDKISLTREGPHRLRAHWEANPHWVKLVAQRHARLPHYLILRGGPREVEIGAFLTPEERRALEIELNRALRTVKSPQH